MILDNERVKIKCQRFTPSATVQEMLQMVDYNAANSRIIGEKVLENSFGNGNVLIEIVKEYIKACNNMHFNAEDISKSLASNIYGIELDTKLFNTTKNRLNALTDSNDIPRVKWKLFNQDALTWNCETAFDYIIGNPPYVTYSEIDVKTRETLRTEFDVCAAGKFDYCYAFIESSLNRLSEKGKLVQLIPNSIYKNVYANELRKKIKDHVKQINIYPSQQLFEDVLTSNSIFAYDKEYNEDRIRCVNKTTNDEYWISRESLHGKWILTGNTRRYGDTEFGDLFRASSSIATLLNEAFIISGKDANNLENEIVRPAVSPKSLRSQNQEYIIFPYAYTEEGQLYRYSEETFTRLFPRITAHLNKYRKKLDARAADNNSRWFEYGRSQALKNINCEKLLMSTVITNRVEVYHVGNESIPYAGIYIVPIEENVDLVDAMAILNSEDFQEYVNSIGIPINGKSIRITCGDINKYRFSRDEII